MNTERYLITLAPSGETFVTEEDAHGMVVAISVALHVGEWSNDGGATPKPDLDLSEFHLEPCDEPIVFHANDLGYFYGPDGDMR